MSSLLFALAVGLVLAADPAPLATAPTPTTPRQERSVSVTVETLNGEFSGKLRSLSTSATPQLVLEKRTLALRDVLSITLNKPIAHRRELRFELVDGSVLFAGIGATAMEDAVAVNGTLFPDDIRLSFEGLQKIYSLDNHELAGPELPTQKTSDLLMTREGATFKGIVEELGRSGVMFEEEQLGSMGRLGWQQIHALAIAPLGPPPKPKSEGVSIWLEGRDGSRVAFQLLSLDLESSKAKLHSPFTGELTVELDRVQSMEFRLGRVAYLSERQPTLVEEGCPHIDEELAPHFAWQRDRSVVEKKPLRIGDQTYARGLGVHSNSKLVFALEERDRLFQCWIGIDVIGKPADEQLPAGSVIFKVLVDGTSKLEQSMSWRDAAKRVQIDVAGAKELTLIVEMGEALHVLDRADWADARVLRD